MEQLIPRSLHHRRSPARQFPQMDNFLFRLQTSTQHLRTASLQCQHRTSVAADIIDQPRRLPSQLMRIHLPPSLHDFSRQMLVCSRGGRL